MSTNVLETQLRLSVCEPNHWKTAVSWLQLIQHQSQSLLHILYVVQSLWLNTATCLVMWLFHEILDVANFTML